MKARKFLKVGLFLCFFAAAVAAIGLYKNRQSDIFVIWAMIWAVSVIFTGICSVELLRRADRLTEKGEPT